MLAAILLAVIVLVSVLAVGLMNEDKRRIILLLCASFLIVAALSFALGLVYTPSYGYAAGLYFGLAAAFFFTMTLYYKKDYGIFFLLSMIAIAQLILCVLYVPSGTAVRGLALAFGVGTSLGFLFLDRDRSANVYKENKKIEINRDLFQITMGIVVIALLLFLKRGFVYSYVILGFIFLGYTFNSMVAATGKMTKLSDPFRRLEREGAIYGAGATYAAAGMALMLGTISDSRFLAFGCVALFIGDSVATLVGKNFSEPRLPFNRHKSLFGFLAFFVFTAALGFLLIGIYAVPIALLLAFVESAGSRFDDNITVPIAAAAAYFLLSLI
jgi:dolichol kinase